jgi:glycosyltransferase involved in cell wall biosynthesis
MNTVPDLNYSAILTCYNAENTIHRAIYGILSQTLPPTEILIVDDFSNDNSLRIIESFCNVHSSIIFIKNSQNMGQSWSRNKAISFATTKFAIIFDDDDVSLPERAEEHLRMFSLGSTVNYVSSRKLYGNGYQVALINKDIFASSLSPREVLLYILLGKRTNTLNSVAIPASTSALSIKEFLQFGGFDEEFRRLEDAELFIRAAQNGGSFAWSSQQLVDRYATFNNTKGGAIETTFELKILSNFRSLASNKESRQIKDLIEMRASYHEHQHIKIFFMLLSRPSTFLALTLKIRSAVMRIVHDFRKEL